MEKQADLGGLSREEQFCIGNSSDTFEEGLRDKIKSAPLLNWLDLDRLFDFMFSKETCGIRQVGRYHFMKNARLLVQTLFEISFEPLKRLGKNNLEIHLFAGLSVGLGGGCYIDVCYILRTLAEMYGWELTIFGYIFLLDVVLNKIGNRLNGEKIALRYSNLILMPHWKNWTITWTCPLPMIDLPIST